MISDNKLAGALVTIYARATGPVNQIVRRLMEATGATRQEARFFLRGLEKNERRRNQIAGLIAYRRAVYLRKHE